LVELEHAYENLNKYWINDTKTKFSFTGGEPAIYKDFLPFVKMLREKGHTIATTTNASATEQYYAELVKYSSITFSIHLRYVEKFGLDKFTKAVRGAVETVLKDRSSGGPASAMWLGVRIMLEPGYKDLAETCYKEFKELFPSLNSVAVQGLHDQNAEQKIKVYAKEEMDWMIDANR
jgi:pyruvate-formate lyase-activating enzyme